MDVTSIAAMAMAMNRAETDQQLSMEALSQALSSESAAVTQLVAQAIQAAPKPGNGQLLDITA